MNVELLEKALIQEIIGAFFTVYNEFGYGFSENVYRNSLVLELQLRSLKVRREVPVDVTYKGRCVGRYRIDVLVEDRVLVETKSSHALVEADTRQVFNYLRASRIQVGLLLHFGPQTHAQAVHLDRKRAQFIFLILLFPLHPLHPRPRL